MATDIIARSAWMAEGEPFRPNTPMIPGAPDGVIVHWVGDSFPAHWSDPRILRAIHDYHMGPDRNYSAIGYSHAIGRGSELFDARGWGVQGAHTSGFNKTAHGLVLLIGKGETATPQMLAQIDNYYAAHVERGGAAKIRVHNDLGNTECPGHQISDYVANMTAPQTGIHGIQARINELGYQPPLKVDGDLGPLTISAIVANLESLKICRQELRTTPQPDIVPPVQDEISATIGRHLRQAIEQHLQQRGD